MAQFRQYDPGQIVINVAGIDVVAVADGTFVNAERAEDAFSMKVGAGGDVTRVRSRNRTGSVTLTLQAASPTNDLFSALALDDELFGTGTGPLLVKDLYGNTLISAETAWIRKLPAVEMADEASNREWVIDCAELIMLVGGSVVS
jgi:hypothetical protein